jgi:hypothetical protein
VTCAADGVTARLVGTKNLDAVVIDAALYTHAASAIDAFRKARRLVAVDIDSGAADGGTGGAAHARLAWRHAVGARSISPLAAPDRACDGAALRLARYDNAPTAAAPTAARCNQ